MARLWQGGAELNSATDGVEVSTNSGTMSISSTTVRSGTYSWRTNPSASTGFFRHNIYTSNSSTTGYFRAYARIATLPGTTIQFLRFSNISNASMGRIDMTSTGALQLKGANGVQIGSNSSALNTGQWYKIELKLDASSSPGSLDARIDGTSFASGANSSQGNWARILWGIVTPNTTADFFFDDVALNDTSGSSQTSWPGDEKIIHLLPNAAGDSNGFLAQVGGTAGSTNNFTRVNEVTPDDATSYNGSALLNAEDLFNMGASGIQSYDTVNVVMVGARIADLVSADATAAFKLEIEKTSGGTKAQSGTIIPNSTTWGTNAGADPRTYPLITYADPDGSAWTNSTLDSMQAGYIQTATNVQTIAISTVWASVAYTPGTPPPSGATYSTLAMMGVG